MKIAILGPVTTQDLSSIIKKKDLKFLPKGFGASVVIIAQLVIGFLKLGHKVSVITLSDDITNNQIVDSFFKIPKEEDL